MNDPRVMVYDLYLAAWSPISAAERRTLLDESLAEQVVFTNPQDVCRGKQAIAAHLEGFQRRIPGGSFRMNNMFGWGDWALAEWQLVDADGTAGFSGSDVITFDIDGMISEILLFGNVESQKLAWRRRDSVTLEFTT